MRDKKIVDQMDQAKHKVVYMFAWYIEECRSTTDAMAFPGGSYVSDSAFVYADPSTDFKSDLYEVILQ